MDMVHNQHWSLHRPWPVCIPMHHVHGRLQSQFAVSLLASTSLPLITADYHCHNATETTCFVSHTLSMPVLADSVSVSRRRQTLAGHFSIGHQGDRQQDRWHKLLKPWVDETPSISLAASMNGYSWSTIYVDMLFFLLFFFYSCLFHCLFHKQSLRSTHNQSVCRVLFPICWTM